MCFNPASGDSGTRRDLARAPGVFESMAGLSHRDREALARDEVRAAAERMGSNAIAAELAGLQRGSRKVERAAVAWIDLRRPAGMARSCEPLAACRQGAEEAARKLGYALEEIHVAPDFSPGDLREVLESKGIGGICIHPQVPHLDWSGFPWKEYPTVRFGQSLETRPCASVSSDHVSNVMLAFARMRELGYRRIGFVACGADSAIHRGRLSEAGFLTAQLSVASGDRVPVLFIGDDFNPSQAKRLAKWVRENRVEGILTDADHALEMLAASGLRAPDDVGLACLSVVNGRSVAGIDQHFAEIGRAGLSLLHSLVVESGFRVSSQTRRMVLAGSWVDGDSLPDRSDRSLGSAPKLSL